MTVSLQVSPFAASAPEAAPLEGKSTSASAQSSPGQQQAGKHSLPLCRLKARLDRCLDMFATMPA